MNTIRNSAIIITLFMMMAFPLHAQDMNSVGTQHPHGITSSGLGTTIATGGNTFDITGGMQKGSNLFHSFGKFNLHTGESAVFHDSGITNTIGRITGGEYSWINGKITSQASNLYLLNPAGIMFGANASLDLQGSFHISTADYLRMGENEKFFAEPMEGEILSIAAPTAFGFLDKNLKGLISIEGKGEISTDEWDGKPSGLAVSEGNTISVIGREIEIKNGAWFRTIESNPLGYVNMNTEKPLGSLSVPGGQINMASIASEGEVIIGESELEIGDATGGNITISDKSLIDVSGEGAGNVFIRCGKFVADDSSFYVKTFGNTDGGGIEIQADTISFENGSEINGDTYGSGNGGDIFLEASDSVIFSGSDELKNASRIFLETYSRATDGADTGILEISARNILFSDGAYILSGTFGSGNGGKLIFRAEDDISFKGVNKDSYANYFLRLYLGDNPVNQESVPGGICNNVNPFSTGGDSGDIEIEADNLFLSDGNSILSTTTGLGDSGSIRIRTAGSLTLSDAAGPSKWAGGISTSTDSLGPGTVSGNAGYISLECGELTLSDGRYISSIANAGLGGICGNGGEVDIRVSGDVTLSGVDPYGGVLGTGSGIMVNSTAGSGGEAGNIFLEAHSLTIEKGADITATTFGNANGGNVEIHVADSINIRGSSPVKLVTATDYTQYAVTESLSRIEASSELSDKDSGNSGTVSVTARNINLSENGLITTSTAGGGDAGNITIETSQMELRNNALIASESTFENGGASGTITINADSVRLSAESAITTEAADTESGEATDGRIAITAGDRLYLNNSEITTSVRGGAGKGGDIDIREPEFVILNHGKIKANAFEGSGGNIHIVSEQFIRSSDSSVEASSEKGIDGNINIESPDTDVTSGLTVPSAEFIDAAKWQKTPCSQRSGENISHFVIRQKDASPTSHDDWQPIMATDTLTGVQK